MSDLKIGDEIAKMSDLKIGDEIVITGTENTCSDDITVGKKYFITDIDSEDDDRIFQDDVGDDRYVRFFQYEVYIDRRTHYDLIIAWADGAVIQYRNCIEWVDIMNPSFLPQTDYRIKPAERVSVGGKSYVKSEYEDAIKDLEYEKVDEYCIGASVMIAETSRWFGRNDELNPSSVGVITKFVDGGRFIVTWSENALNGYDRSDLIIVGSKL